MQIPGQNAEAPFRRQISQRENAMKLCLGTISVNDEIRFFRPRRSPNHRGWYGAPRGRRSGSHLIYARKHRVYERRHPLAAPTCERRVIARRAPADSGTAWRPHGGPSKRRPGRLVMVVSHLFNFRAVHRPVLGPSARPLDLAFSAAGRGSRGRSSRPSSRCPRRSAARADRGRPPPPAATGRP